MQIKRMETDQHPKDMNPEPLHKRVEKLPQTEHSEEATRQEEKAN